MRDSASAVFYGAHVTDKMTFTDRKPETSYNQVHNYSLLPYDCSNILHPPPPRHPQRCLLSNLRTGDGHSGGLSLILGTVVAVAAAAAVTAVVVLLELPLVMRALVLLLLCLLWFPSLPVLFVFFLVGRSAVVNVVVVLDCA